MLGHGCWMTGCGAFPWRDWRKVFTNLHPPGFGPIFLCSVPTKCPSKTQALISESRKTRRAQSWWTRWKMHPFLWVCASAVAACDGRRAEDWQQEQSSSTGSFSWIPLIRLLIVNSFDSVLLSDTHQTVSQKMLQSLTGITGTVVFFSFLFVNWLKANINIYLQLGKCFAARNLNVLFSTNCKRGNY